MKQRLLLFICCLLAIAQGAWAQDATVIDGISYQLNSEDKTAKVVQCSGSGTVYTGDIVIPDYVEQDGTKCAQVS